MRAARHRAVLSCMFSIVIGTITAISANAQPTQAVAQAMTQADAVRLLEQATFGPTPALVDHVMSVGARAFLAEQFAAPASRYPVLKYVPAGGQATFCPTDPDPQCGRDYYTMFLLQNAFFHNALTGSDQLRQRVAFALSQILVTSGLSVRESYGMGAYQQIFLDNAFGNYEDILAKVTLSPVMGDYLNMANNDKAAGAVNPNENYAREVLQLFSTGVWELNKDGTLLLDAHGQPIPTYTQDTVEGFANLFTGWTYPPLPGAPARTHNPKNYLSPMVAVQAKHDTGSKLLLDGFVEPAGLTAQADVTHAIHDIFVNANVGPFICRQLIQKLVTGNPLPAYVTRVNAVFDNNGAGVRGDMQAVVTAILTDPDARGDLKTDAGYGKLREPVLFMTGLARAVNTQSDGVYLGQQSAVLGQDLFNPASVFNYYPPTYVVPGTSLLGPEFALQNASTTINRYNFGNALAFGTIGPLSTLPGATGTVPDWSELQAVAGDAGKLLAQLDMLLLHGTMSASTSGAILPAVNAIPASNTLARAKTAFYLVATSPQYQVER
jgi:uncharacterized protein (DUF1800 family)